MNTLARKTLVAGLLAAAALAVPLVVMAQSAASADKGQAVVQAAGAALAQLLAELHALPLSTLAPRPGPP